MQGIPLDSETKVVEVRYAVVYAPRRSRGRFAESCVTLVFDEQEAQERADPARYLFAAKVIGPSVSSESQRIYYLDDWL